MNPAIERTVLHMQCIQERLFNPETLSVDALQVVERSIEEDVNLPALDETDNHFKGLVIVRYLGYNRLEVHIGQKSLVDDSDKQTLLNWLREKTHTPYVDDFYRIDLSQAILMCKAYELGGERVLVGHIMDNSRDARLNLLEIRQHYLMRKFT